MEQGFEAIVLSETGDFLVETEASVEIEDKGVTIHEPFIYTEEDKAQRIRAEKIFIPYSSLESIQYGDFKEGVVE
ncbi:MAG: hypothetical protein ABEJ99_00465 [Candidatus Nanohaloarchaea archaeon]